MSTRFQLGGVVLVLLAFLSGAGAQQLSEEQVKAGFLFNFSKFVEWPAGSFAGLDSPVTVCVVGDRSFGDTLQEMVRGKVSGRRALQVKNIALPEHPPACHIVYFAVSSPNAKELLTAFRSSSVLTVGNSEGFLQAGGIVTFLKQDDRVRFAINADAARNANVRISSRMLSLAKVYSNGSRSSGE